MVQYAETKAMVKETTETEPRKRRSLEEPRKVGRVHIMLGLEGPARSQSLA